MSNNKSDELANGMAPSVAQRQALQEACLGPSCPAQAGFGLAQSAVAGGPTYTTIHYPGSLLTLAVDINDFGQIVGEYTYATIRRRQGFILSNGVYTSITFPRSYFTRAIGINRHGDVVGNYILADSRDGNEHGYLLRGGVFTSISVPNAKTTLAQGINANGDIVGTYKDRHGKHGFLLRGGTFTAIDFPGTDGSTEAWKINDNGDIVGRYGRGDSKYRVYTFIKGRFSSVPDMPGAAQVAPGNFSEVGGINNFRDILSNYASSNPDNLNSTGNLHGFLLSGGQYTTLDFPNAAWTLAFGVNGSDNIVGLYEDAGGIHGFLRVP